MSRQNGQLGSIATGLITCFRACDVICETLYLSLVKALPTPSFGKLNKCTLTEKDDLNELLVYFGNNL